MTIAATIRTILLDAASRDVRPNEGTGRVWELTYPSLFSFQSRQRAQSVDAVKRQVLETLARVGTAVIYHHEPPDEANVPGVWQSAQGPGAWRIPVSLDLSEPAIAYWLFSLGNWTLCTPDAVLGHAPDIARAPAAELVGWIDQRGLEVVIDSFHDDVSWVVVLGDTHDAG